MNLGGIALVIATFAVAIIASLNRPGEQQSVDNNSTTDTPAQTSPETIPQATPAEFKAMADQFLARQDTLYALFQEALTQGNFGEIGTTFTPEQQERLLEIAQQSITMELGIPVNDPGFSFEQMPPYPNYPDQEQWRYLAVKPGVNADDPTQEVIDGQVLLGDTHIWIQRPGETKSIIREMMGIDNAHGLITYTSDTVSGATDSRQGGEERTIIDMPKSAPSDLERTVIAQGALKGRDYQQIQGTITPENTFNPLERK